MSVTDPIAVSPFEAEVDVYFGKMLVRLYREKDYGYGPQRTQVAYFHSGDVNDAIAALEGAMVEAHKQERWVERVEARRETMRG